MDHQQHLERYFFFESLAHRIDDTDWDLGVEEAMVELQDSMIESGRGLVRRFVEVFLEEARRPVFEAAVRQHNVQHCCVQSGSFDVVDHAQIGDVAPILLYLEVVDLCHVELRMNFDGLLLTLLEDEVLLNELELEQGRPREECYKYSVITSMHNLNRL